MRPHLLHPLAERRPARRRGGRRGAQAPASRQAQEPALRPTDTATQRVRDAGGPIDRASYTCECGLLFQARVSTTVMCPHCGAGQAW